MLVLPVPHRPGAAGGFDVRRDHLAAVVGFGQGEGDLQAVQGGPGIPLDQPGQQLQGLVLGSGLFPPEGAAQQYQDGLVGQRFEPEQRAA